MDGSCNSFIYLADGRQIFAESKWMAPLGFKLQIYFVRDGKELPIKDNLKEGSVFGEDCVNAKA